ncbi:hypothetical protein [Methanopyrus sp.]
MLRSVAVAGDLDRFGEVVREKGWSEYSPNPATGLLTELVERFLSRFPGAVAVKGPDRERGTEEFVVEIPGGDELLDEILEECERIRIRFEREFKGEVTISLGVGIGPAPVGRRSLREPESPAVRRALEALREAKRKGGNTVVVRG